MRSAVEHHVAHFIARIVAVNEIHRMVIVKLDPALMAGPKIATLVDIVTLVIYFGLAKVYLL